MRKGGGEEGMQKTTKLDSRGGRCWLVAAARSRADAKWCDVMRCDATRCDAIRSDVIHAIGVIHDATRWGAK